MYFYRINIDKCELLDGREVVRKKIQDEMYNFVQNKWLEGIIINVGKININEIDLDLKLYYQIEYTENLDENYLKEEERLQIGL